MKVLLEQDEDGNFGGTLPLDAVLDDATIDEHRMRPALVRFGKALAKQFEKGEFRDNKGSKIIGVDLRKIEFAFITKRV
jgi:hypothetical protein